MWRCLIPSLNLFQRFCVAVIRCGPVPTHIAFIMDGNRRYAKKTRTSDKYGHTPFMIKLSEIFYWCFELRITEITFFALHEKTLSRDKEEVDAILKLGLSTIVTLINSKTTLMVMGVRVKVFGKLSVLPAELRNHIMELVLITKGNNKIVVNVGIAYTFREDLVNATKDIVDGFKADLINVDDIDENLIIDCLYTNSCSPPDIIVRTSGKDKFSNFCLWQIGYSQIYFCKALWPEMSVWHLLDAVFKYQTCYSKLKKWEKNKLRESSTLQEFLKYIENKRITELKELVD